MPPPFSCTVPAVRVDVVPAPVSEIEPPTIERVALEEFRTRSMAVSDELTVTVYVPAKVIEAAYEEDGVPLLQFPVVLQRPPEALFQTVV